MKAFVPIVAVGAALLGVIAGVAARPHQTNFPGLMPTVVVTAPGPRPLLDEIVVRPSPAAHASAPVAGAAAFN